MQWHLTIYVCDKLVSCVINNVGGDLVSRCALVTKVLLQEYLSHEKQLNVIVN